MPVFLVRIRSMHGRLSTNSMRSIGTSSAVYSACSLAKMNRVKKFCRCSFAKLMQNCSKLLT